MQDVDMISAALAAAQAQEAKREVSLLAQDQYFRWMGYLPRWLSLEEERRCFEAVARGKAEQQTTQPDATLLAQVQEARERLVASYQRLVVKIASEFVKRCHSLDVMDLIQEGNLGLLQAIESNKPDRDWPFLPLAARCIRHAISGAIWQSDATIRLSWRMHEFVDQVRKVVRDWQREHGEPPMLAEVAEVMQVEEGWLREVYEAVEREQVVSLEAVVAQWEEADESKLALLACAEASSCRGTDAAADVCERLQQALAQLYPLQREVLRLHYGLGEDTSGTLAMPEVAERLGKTVKAVWQIECSARKHLARWLVAMEHQAERSNLPYYSIQEACERLGCSKDMLYNTMSRARIPCVPLPWPHLGKGYAKEAVEAAAGYEQPYYTLQEAIAKLGCSPMTLARYAQMGKVPVMLKAGKTKGRVYPQAAIDALAANPPHTRGPRWGVTRDEAVK